MIADWVAKAVKLFQIIRRPGLVKPLWHGVAAGVEHFDVLCRTKAIHVIDVGANRGQFATAVAHGLPTARIDAFEPLAAPRDLMERLAPGGRRLVVHPFALGAAAATCTIHQAARDDSSSLLPPGPLQEMIFPGTATASRHDVEVRRLDAVLRPDDILRPSMLKIDVQGYELEVLRGAAGVLPAIDWVYVECSFLELYVGQPLFAQIAKAMAEYGFVVAGLYNPVVRPGFGCVQADILFQAGDRA